MNFYVTSGKQNPNDFRVCLSRRVQNCSKICVNEIILPATKENITGLLQCEQVSRELTTEADTSKALRVLRLIKGVESWIQFSKPEKVSIPLPELHTLQFKITDFSNKKIDFLPGEVVIGLEIE